MAALALRDRDAIVTKEGLIFRVFGYSHPRDAYVCDLEYAPASVFRSSNPKAPRGHPRTTHYKLYEDEAWTYLKTRYPQYLILHAMLQRKVIGVRHCDIAEVRRPQEKLKELLSKPEKDDLIRAMQNLLTLVTDHSDLHLEDFGVFGSMLHSFHNPKLSDIDLTVCGKEKATKLREALKELYTAAPSLLQNEFETDQTIQGKRWRFRNLSPREYEWHQRRKLIYALFNDRKSRRIVKTEFEPVKDANDSGNGYDPEAHVLKRGWARMTARITADNEAQFIPSIYGIKPLAVIEGGIEAAEARRIVSYMEEFRLQANKDERVYVEGNLEEVTVPDGHRSQVTLTYCPRYYEQVLKGTDSTSGF